MHVLITSKTKELKTLCQRYGVLRLFAFGSVTGAHFDPERSDLDFLVVFKPELSPKQMGANMLDMMDELETLFGKKVDLLRDRPFANPIFAKSVHASKKLLYAAA